MDDERGLTTGTTGQSQGAEFRRRRPNSGTGRAHARESGIDYEDFLLELTTTELHARTENRLKRRLQESKFTRIKQLETFDLAAVLELDLRPFRELASGRFIQERNKWWPVDTSSAVQWVP